MYILGLHLALKTEKERQRTRTVANCIVIHPDHSRRRIEIQFCVLGAIRAIALSFKFYQNRLSGYRDVRVKLWITLANGLYTALYYGTGVTTCVLGLQEYILS